MFIRNPFFTISLQIRSLSSNSNVIKKKQRTIVEKIVSPQLKAVIGLDKATYGEASDLLWGYLGKNHLSSKKNRYHFHTDEILKPLFQNKDEFHFKEVSTALFNNLTHEGDAIDAANTRRRRGPYVASPELASIIGNAPVTRMSDGAKRLWAYIKENNLALGGKPCKVKVDATLSKLFKGDTICMTQIFGVLSKNIMNMKK